MGRIRGLVVAAVAVVGLAVPAGASAAADSGISNASFTLGTTNHTKDTVIVTFTATQTLYDAAVGLTPYSGTVTSASSNPPGCGANHFQNNSEWPNYDGMWGAQCTFYPIPHAGDKVEIRLITSVTYEADTLLLNNQYIPRSGTSPPKPFKDPEKARQKLEAQKDMIKALDAAQAPCAQSTLGAAAGVWATTVPVAGAMATVPALVILGGSGSQCAALIQRAYKDAQIVNDPPAKDFTQLAVVASAYTAAARSSCARFSGAVRTFCTKLRALEARYLAAQRRVVSIDGALLTTVDRESGAAKAHKRKALALQDRRGVQLERQLSAARAREHKLGAQIANLIRSHHVRGELTTRQVARGIAYIKAQLEQRGISAARLQQLAGSALTPHAINILSDIR